MDTIHVIPDTYDFPEKPPIIPALLHMIWVGPNEAPKYVNEYCETWRILMPTWQIRLWTNADLTAAEFPVNLLAKINAATSGAQKADLMRYYIIYRHGGVYLDTDVIPHRSLEPIRGLGPLVLCHDMPLSWAYISIGFFAAVPYHPVLDYACRLCLSAPLNTSDIHMQTGPRILGEAVLRTPPPTGEKYQALHCYFFYRNMVGQQKLNGYSVTTDFDARFACHFYAKMW
jgi:mannosyltransferase OCH1-like enzyme